MLSKEIKPQSITYGATVLLLSTVLVKLIGALFKIPLSSDYCLGDVGFGYFSSVYDLFLPIYALAISGFPVAISRIVADYIAQNKHTGVLQVFKVSFRALLVFGLAGTLLILISSIEFVRLTDTTGQSLYSLLLLAPSMLFCSLASVYRGYFEGHKNMTPTAVSNIIEALGKLILGLSLAIFTVRITGNPALGAAAAMFGITVGTLASLVFLVLSYKFSKKSEGKIKITDEGSIKNSSVLREIIKFSVPIVLSSLSIALSSLIDAFTVKIQLSSFEPQVMDRLYGYLGETEILPTVLYGIRSKAQTLFNLVPTITAAFGISALPTLTESFVKGEKLQLNKQINNSLKFSAFVSIAATAGFISTGKYIMEFLYSQSASSQLGGKLLSIYAIAALFAGMCVPMTSYLQAVGKQNTALINILIGLLIKLCLNLILTPITQLNIYGCVISTSVCYCFIFFANFLALCRALDYTCDFKNIFLKPFFAALLCGASAFFVVNLSDAKIMIVAAIFIGFCVYFALLFLTGSITTSDFYEIIGNKTFFKKSVK